MTSNYHESAQQRYHDAVKLINLPTSLHARLMEPERITDTHFPIQLDDGSILIMRGIRILHSSLLGTGKGGVRASDQRNEFKRRFPSKSFDDCSKRDLVSDAIEECGALAKGMTWKSGLHKLPFGGAKGLLLPDYAAMQNKPEMAPWLSSDRVFPSDISNTERDQIWRQFTRRISAVIGPKKDVLAPDVGTGPVEMSIIRDEVSRMMGYAVPGVVTGKPLSIGGSHGRFEATGLGGFFQIVEILKKRKIKWENANFAIQGFGNAGMIIAKWLHKYDLKISAVADSCGGIYNPKGLDVLKVIEAKQNGNEGVRSYLSLVSESKAEKTIKITSEELLELPVTILILAALHDQITEQNAHKIQAEVVSELANGPTTFDGASILCSRGILLHPDILCNAGGLVVSHIEWVQDNDGLFWDEEPVFRRLKKVMLRSFGDVCDISEEMGITMSEAAMALGVARVAAAGLDLSKASESGATKSFPPAILHKVCPPWSPTSEIDVLEL